MYKRQGCSIEEILNSSFLDIMAGKEREIIKRGWTIDGYELELFFDDETGCGIPERFIEKIYENSRLENIFNDILEVIKNE